MKYFKDKGGTVWAYESYVTPAEMREGLVPMTPEEVAAHLNPVKSVSEIAAALQALVDAEYKRQMGIITAKYPDEERRSWYIQAAQAQAVLSGADTATPWIDACAKTRGMSRDELAQRIADLDAQFQGMNGFLTGVRQWHEEAIGLIVAAAAENEIKAREDLASYDVMQGWSSLP